MLNRDAVDRQMLLTGISTYRELARRLGWHETTLNRVLCGRRKVRARHAIAIANVLGVGFTDLLQSEEVA